MHESIAVPIRCDDIESAAGGAAPAANLLVDLPGTGSDSAADLPRFKDIVDCPIAIQIGSRLKAEGNDRLSVWTAIGDCFDSLIDCGSSRMTVIGRGGAASCSCQDDQAANRR
jgi:hypothetical protein